MSTDDTNTLTFGCSDAINNPRQRQSAVSVGPVFMGASGLDERIYALYDANWNITALLGWDETASAYTVQEQFVYSPYGVQTVVTAAGNHLMADGYNWVYGFQGERTDPITGEVESASREEDPTTGTWLEQDPAGYVNGANTYQFVGDDPASHVDPSGNASQCVFPIDDKPDLVASTTDNIDPSKLNSLARWGRVVQVVLSLCPPNGTAKHIGWKLDAQKMGTDYAGTHYLWQRFIVDGVERWYPLELPDFRGTMVDDATTDEILTAIAQLRNDILAGK